MTLLILAAVGCLLAALPAVLTLANLRLYQPPPLVPQRREAVSVLIPARNEEAGIGAAIESVLANVGVPFELLVLDDQSEDRTAQIVQEAAAKDRRVKLLAAPPLPEGWCGKQHACQRLTDAAAHEWLVFLDADVRLAPNALARLVAFMQESEADLGSGFPCQLTGTLLEKLIVPLIHFLLLGFLPLARMRQFPTQPIYAAGCGQLFIARREGYRKAGGHAAIRASLHDGIKLPRAFRAAGLKTDLCDATSLAVCRMYTSGRGLWRGFGKNATEGLASSLPSLLVWTALLAGGAVLPWAVYAAVSLQPSAAEPTTMEKATILLAFAGLFLSYLPRFVMAGRFRQSLLGMVLHPLGVVLVLALQWQCWLRARLGRPVGWKGRGYAGVG